MGSATPRVESFYRAHTGDLELATLPERVSGRPLPPIEVVDLRDELKAGNTNALSLTLDRALQECHADGGQSILFLNRRGTLDGGALPHLRRSVDVHATAACPSCTTSTARAATVTTAGCRSRCRARVPHAARERSARSAWAPSGSSARCANASRRCA